MSTGNQQEKFKPETFEEFEAEVARNKANEARADLNKDRTTNRINELTKLLDQIRSLKNQLSKFIEKKAIEESAKATLVPESPVNKTTSGTSGPIEGTSGSVADENQQLLRKLEDDILAGKRPSFRSALLKPFKFDEAYFEHTLSDRETRLNQAYKKGDVLGLIGITNERIRDRKGIAGLPDSIDDYLMSKLSKSSEPGSNAQKFVSQMELRRAFRKRKGKSGGNLFSTALTVIIRSITNTVSKTVDRVATGVKDATLGRAARSKAGVAITNAATSIKAKFAESKLVQGYEKVSTTLGKVVDVMDDFRGGIGHIGKGLGRGAFIGGVAAIAFGGSPVAGIVLGTGSGLAAIGSNFVNGRKFNARSLWKFQAKHGVDWRFIKPDGTYNIELMERAAKRFGLKNFKMLFGKTGQILSMTNSAFGWGTVGSALGSLVGVAVGGPAGMAIGATIGLASGAAAGVGWNRLAFAAKVSQKPIVAMLKTLPSFDIMSKMQTNLWIGSQIDLIMRKYKGNVGKFLKDNYFGGDANRSTFENILTLSSNWLNLGFGVHGMLSTTGTRTILSGLASFSGKFAKFAKLGTLLESAGKFNLASIGGSIAGTAISYAVLTALGLPIGAGAIIGMTIGGIVGNIAAAILTATTGIGGAVAFFFSNTILIPIGGLIGGAIDKATNKLVQGASMMFNTLSAIMNLLALIKGKFDVDNLVMVVLALISLFQAFDKMGMFETAYQCVNDASCPDVNRDAGYGQAPTINFLDNYDLGLINNSNLSQIQKENLYAYLDKNSAQITQKFPEKKVILNLMDDTSFETPQMIILGLDSVHTLTEEDISNQISLQLESWSSDKILPENIFNL